MTRTVSSIWLVSTAICLVCFIIGQVSSDGGYGDGGYGSVISRRNLIEELRSQLHGLEINPWFTTESNLERMLIESHYSVGRAAKRLRKTALFRGRVGADHLLEWKPSEHFITNLPYECTGYAYDGSPVILFPFGRWNTPRLFRLSRKREFYNYVLRMLEEAIHQTKGRKNPITGKPVDQVVFIVDAKGYNLRKLLTLRATYTLLRLANAIDRHYPFLVQKWYIMNTPLTFHALKKLIRLSTSARLARTVEVYSSFTTNGANALAHNIPKDAIPNTFGGLYVPKFEEYITPPETKLTRIATKLNNVAGAWPSSSHRDEPWEDEKPVAYGPPGLLNPPVQYGAPSTKSIQYESPRVKADSQYDASTSSKTQYGAPSKSPASFDTPPAQNSADYDHSSDKASGTFGIRLVKTSNPFGAPISKPSSQYGAPVSKPSNQYSTTSTKSSSQYSAPSTKISSQYGPQSSKTSSQQNHQQVKTEHNIQTETSPAQYNFPLTNPTTKYGPATTKIPTQYGPPSVSEAPSIDYDSSPSHAELKQTEEALVSALSTSPQLNFDDDLESPTSSQLSAQPIINPSNHYATLPILQPEPSTMHLPWQYGKIINIENPYGKTFLVSSGHL